MAKQKQVDKCLQCEGDAMLEVRKHAQEAFAIMDAITATYYTGHVTPKPGVTIVEWVQALIAAEQDQRRLRHMLRHDAEQKTKEIADLIAAMKFVSATTKEAYSSGANLSSKSMTIPLTEVFRVLIQRLEGLAISYKGLLEGKQPHNEVDFLKDILVSKVKE